MKKIILFLCVLAALLTVSCNNILVSDKDDGSVSLVIDSATAQSIRSALVARNATVGDSREVTARLVGDYEDSATKTVSAAALDGTSFTFENVPVGKEIRLLLEVKKGSSLLWYGSSNAHRVKSGTNTLHLALGRVSGVLLWKEYSSLNIAPYGNLDAKGTVLSDEIISRPVYCYDNRGNLYIAGDNVVSRFDLQADGSYTSAAVSRFVDVAYFSALSYDNATIGAANSGTLYGIGAADNGTLDGIGAVDSGASDGIGAADNGTLYLWAIAGKELQSVGKTPIVGEIPILDSVGFAVYDGIAYVANVANYSQIEQGFNEIIDGVATITVSKYDVNKPSPLLTNKITLPGVFISEYPAPTVQMIYQDGALYLLLGSAKDSAPVVSSVGAVVKINPTTLDLDTSFGKDGCLGLVSTRRDVSYGEGQVYHVYAASSPTQQVFTRPLGFVAIMPKKLVIADAGWIVYNEIVEQEWVNKLKGAAVSRIVTVDLETQSLGFENLEPDKYYWTNNPLGSSVDIGSAY